MSCGFRLNVSTASLNPSLEQCVVGLLQGGEPDLSTVSKMVLNDWQRGRIPFFVKPPGPEGDQVVRRPSVSSLNDLFSWSRVVNPCFVSVVLLGQGQIASSRTRRGS